MDDGNDLARLVWSWWLNHRKDKDSVGNRNVYYDVMPDFVAEASNMLNRYDQEMLYQIHVDNL